MLHSLGKSAPELPSASSDPHAEARKSARGLDRRYGCMDHMRNVGRRQAPRHRIVEGPRVQWVGGVFLDN